jgi:C-terminal processing protease CtpA/Prc
MGIVSCILWAGVLSGASLCAQFPISDPVTNPGFEEGVPGEAPPGWRFYSRLKGAYSVRVVSENCQSGRQCALLQSDSHAPAGATAILYQNFDVRSYRNQRFRFRAAVRTEVSGPGNFANLWVRVFREDMTDDFYADPTDRPITSPGWTYYEISGMSPEAATIDVGIAIHGSGAAWLDDVSFSGIADGPVEPARPFTPRGLDNVRALARLFGYIRYFHPTDEAAAADWNRLAISAVRTIEPAQSPAELASKLRAIFAPIAPTVLIFPTASKPPPLVMEASPQIVMWQHNGVGVSQPSPSGYRSTRIVVSSSEAGDALRPFRADLPGGVSCIVPIALNWDASKPPLDPPFPPAPGGTPNDRATRLAAIVIAWNVFEHFYPYFDVVPADWTSELGALLSEAAEDKDAHAFRTTLQKLTVILQDGHGYLDGPGGSPSFIPPVIWTWADNRIVARSVRNAVDIKPGDALLTIDGRPAADVLAEKEALTPGSTPQCVRYRALSYLLTRGPRDKVRLELEPVDSPGVRRSATLDCTARAGELREPRPEKVHELEPGIFYLDLDRITDEDFSRALPSLAKATGIVFDLRGYPNNILQFREFFGHLIDRPIWSPQIQTPLVTRPDRTGMAFPNRGQWFAAPVEPYFTAKRAFLTDGRAISYAETLLLMVEHYKLAEIVGEPTAGTDGMVNPFQLPGGFKITWTGARVLKQDGSPLHGVGVIPTIPVELTRKGIAAGRDEALERAIQAVKE